MMLIKMMITTPLIIAHLIWQISKKNISLKYGNFGPFFPPKKIKSFVWVCCPLLIAKLQKFTTKNKLGLAGTMECKIC